MSTLKTTNITHGSNTGTANLVLASDGDITFAKKPALGRQILEQFYTPCDGSVIATSAGNLTVPTVTGVQTLTSTHTDITGSSIAYTPPSGTTQVIYRFSFHWSRAGDDNTRGHFKLFIDSDEVTNARLNSGGGANYGGEGQVHFEWGINIGGSAVTATGRQASWSSSKTLKIQGREYEGAIEQKLHQTYYWDGAASNQFSQPCVGITAIG